MNPRTTAIARRQRERLQAQRRARLVDACRDKARTVRSLSRALGVCERTVRRSIQALGPVLVRERPRGQRRGWLYRAVDTTLDDARFEATTDACFGRLEDGR